MSGYGMFPQRPNPPTEEERQDAEAYARQFRFDRAGRRLSDVDAEERPAQQDQPSSE